jgi:Uma2 family endonuclease
MAIDNRQPAVHMVWEDDDLVLNLAPLQGRWTADQYLLLSEQTSRLIEFADGVVEVLPMPTDLHQRLVRAVFLAFYLFLEPRGGTVLFAPLRLQIRPDTFREPDILALQNRQDDRRQERFWLGADLVVEVVSPDNPERDLRDKRREYAEAGIAEYWIVNPQEGSITVLTLDGSVYVEHGTFGRGEQATSSLLAGFSLDVDSVLGAE